MEKYAHLIVPGERSRDLLGQLHAILLALIVAQLWALIRRHLAHVIDQPQGEVGIGLPRLGREVPLVRAT